MRGRCCTKQSGCYVLHLNLVSQLCEKFQSRVSGLGVHQIVLNSANAQICEHRRHPACPIFGSGLGRSNRFRLSDQDNRKARSQKVGFGPIGNLDDSVGRCAAEMVRGFGTLLDLYDKTFTQIPIFGSPLQHEFWLNRFSIATKLSRGYVGSIYEDTQKQKPFFVDVCGRCNTGDVKSFCFYFHWPRAIPKPVRLLTLTNRLRSIPRGV